MNGDYNSGLIFMEYHCELIVINTLYEYVVNYAINC